MRRAAACAPGRSNAAALSRTATRASRAARRARSATQCGSGRRRARRRISSRRRGVGSPSEPRGRAGRCTRWERAFLGPRSVPRGAWHRGEQKPRPSKGRRHPVSPPLLGMEAPELQLLAVLAVPHLLYAFIWFKPATFRALCGKKGDAVTTFYHIAAALKGAATSLPGPAEPGGAAMLRRGFARLTRSAAIHGGVPLGNALRAAQPAGGAARAVGAGGRAVRRRPGEPTVPNCRPRRRPGAAADAPAGHAHRR